MSRPELGGETLMAYVDGGLDVETARAVEEAAARDESVAARIAALKHTRDESKKALAPLLAEPVPDELVAKVRAFAARHQTSSPPETPAAAGLDTDNDAERGSVVPFAPRVRSPRWAGSGLGMGLAASLALVVGLGGGFFAAGGADRFGKRVETPQFDQPGLLEALYGGLSGEERTLPGGERYRAIATFAVDGGTLCREFEVDGTDANTVVAVACHDDGAWRTRFTVASRATGEGYAPASSLDVLQAYLSAVGAGDPLDLPAETKALNALR
ncbi:MAG: anti-sigma factor [Pseudomonadota bacterium]